MLYPDSIPPPVILSETPSDDLHMKVSRIFAPVILCCTAAGSAVSQADAQPILDAQSYQCRPPSANSQTVTLKQSPLAVSRDGKAINAALGRPQGRPPKAVVIFLHGYSGSMDEIPVRKGEGMFLRAARMLAQADIASVRFDFIGSGKSEGAWADTTFDGQTLDALAVLKTLRADPELADLPGHFLGFSQGGLVALQAAAKGARVSSLVLWNPVLDPFATYGRILGNNALESGMALARDGKPGALVGNSGLNAAFFQGIEKTDPTSLAEAFVGPILMATAKKDKTAANGPANGLLLKKQRRAATDLIVVDADHALGVTRNTKVIDQVIGCTVGFIKAKSGIAGTAHERAEGAPVLQ
jgi:hypothetical protein